MPVTISLQKLPKHSLILKDVEQRPLIFRVTDYKCLCNLLPLGILMLISTSYLKLSYISIFAIGEIVVGLIFNVLLIRRLKIFWHHYRAAGIEYLVNYRRYLRANLVLLILLYSILGLLVYYLKV